MRGRSLDALDRLAVEPQDHVAGLDSGLLRRPVLLDARDQRALRLRKADRLGDVPRHGFDPDADAAADHAPGVRSCCCTFFASSIGIANEMPL